MLHKNRKKEGTLHEKLRDLRMKGINGSFTDTFLTITDVFNNRRE